MSSPLRRRLVELCRSEPPVIDLRDDPRLASRCLHLLEAAAPVEAVWRGPVYAFPEAFRFTATARIVAVTPAGAELLAPHLPDWLPDVVHRQPFFAAVVDGAAVAVCASVRISPKAHQAGVETHPAFRRQGLARQVVGTWAMAVRRAGAVPLYSTSWTNLASQGVAGSLGLEPAAADFHVR